MNTTTTEIDNIFKNDQSDKQIDLKIILKILKRGKFFIVTFTFLTTLFGAIFAYKQPKLWQGSFEIVLENTNNNNNSSSSPILQSLQSELGVNDTNLDTQVSILKSSSVLKPVYLFALNYKKNSGEEVSNWAYKNWVNNHLKFQLIENTQILEIKYNDQDKEFIRPVLKKISETYQKYSISTRSENLTSSINFVSKELKQAKENFRNISLKTQSFQLKNKIGDARGLPQVSLSDIDIPNIESSDSLPPLKKEPSSLDKKMTRFDYHYNNLQRLESDLVLKSAIYKPESNVIKSIKDKIETIKESLDRPEEILYEYNNIIRDYYKNESIVSNLEIQLYNLKFAKAKQITPWRLISDTTIKDYPISPNKKLLIIFSFIFGFLISSFLTILKNQLSKIIFEFKDFSKLLKYEFLIKFPIFGSQYWEQSVNIFESIINFNLKNNKLIIFILSDEYTFINNNAINDLTKKINSKDLIFTNNIKNIANSSKIIFIAFPGKMSSEEIQLINSKINVMNCDCIGWAYLEQNY